MSYSRATHGSLPFRGARVGPRELFTILRASKRFIIIAAVVVSLASFTVALLLPRTYEATTVLAPVSNARGSGSLSGEGSPLAGLAELAGLSSTVDSKRAESVALLQSDMLTEKYIRDNNLLPILYENLWDAAGRRWKVSDPDKIPTLWRANELFKKRIRDVRIDRTTDLVKLTIVWKDPRLAATWANGLVRMANDYLRTQAVTDSERNIAYLEQEAAKTNLVEARQVIYSALRVEMGKLMQAKGKQEYAFKVIDPALVVENAIPPERVVWLPVGLLLGLFLACFLVTLRAALV
jgi:uncharacterized protein involved in exopolysaccharide biosynthesis